jgi:glycosyltransferase involved in cell wall biosynthesis
MMTKHFISIILPVYNQADHIEDIVNEYERDLVKIPYPHESILVVNGCRDNSLDVCKRLEEKLTSVRVVFNERGGWGLAVKLGLHEALGDILCYTNSARTNSRDLLLLLMYAVANPGAVIKANRKNREIWYRRLGSLLYNLECRTLFDLSYWDINGTPKVFPRSFDKLLRLTQKNDLFDAEFNIVCRRENYPTIEVPIFSVHRHGGESTTNFKSALRMYFGIYNLWRKMRENY